jgi:hypothetical protein
MVKLKYAGIKYYIEVCVETFLINSMEQKLACEARSSASQEIPSNL